MKLDALRKVIREEVKAAIQEELKDILLEAVRSPKQVVRETVAPAPVAAPAIPQKTREEIRESYKNILGDTVYMDFETPLYKLRIGNYTVRKNAEKAIKTISRLGIKDSWIIRAKAIIEDGK